MSAENTAISEILRLIDDCEWHELFSAHERFNLSPPRIIEAIEYLNGIGLIEQDGKRIRLKITNDHSVLSKVRHIFLDHQFIIESDSRYSDSTLSINELYTPEIRLLDESLKIDD